MIGQILPKFRMVPVSIKIEKGSFDSQKKRFANLKQIGRGAYGTALSGKLKNKKVIIKTSTGTPGLVSYRSALDSMAHEVQILNKIQKFPFVPRLLEVGSNYFVQEDTAGDSMLNLLSKKGMEAREILSVVVASGIILSQLHKEGVAHGDAEARNILLSPEGVMIIDFGLAALRDHELARFKELMINDVLNLLENMTLVLTSRSLPDNVRIVLASTLEKYRKLIIAQKINEETAGELSKELLFILAQLGAQAERGKVIPRDKIKVIAV